MRSRISANSPAKLAAKFRQFSSKAPVILRQTVDLAFEAVDSLVQTLFHARHGAPEERHNGDPDPQHGDDLGTHGANIANTLHDFKE